MERPDELTGGREGPAAGSGPGVAAPGAPGTAGASIEGAEAAGRAGAAGAGAAAAAGRAGAAGAAGRAGAAGVTTGGTEGAEVGAAGGGAAAGRVIGRGEVTGRGEGAGAVTSLAGRLVINPERSDRVGWGAGGGVGDPPLGALTSGDVFVALAAGVSSATSSGWTARRSPSLSAFRRTRSAWASSIEEEWLLTPMPSDTQRSSASLFVRPSSRANS